MYTGENQVPDFNICDYAIGFHYIDFQDRYIRFPLYHFYQQDYELAMKKHEMSDKQFYIQYRGSAMNSASLGEDFYNKVKPYWDYSYKQILEAEGDLKYAARGMGLCKLIELIQAGYVYSPMSLLSKCRAIREAAQHPLIIEVASNLDLKDSRLEKMEKLKLLLIKNRWWLVLYILVSLYYRRNRK